MQLRQNIKSFLGSNTKGFIIVMQNMPDIVVAIARISPGNAGLLGTGFFISKNLVVTTAHVTGPEDKELHVAIKNYNNSEYQDTTDTTANIIKSKILAYDPVRDISILKIDNETNAPNARLISTDSLPIGCHLITLGYPHANHGRMVLTQQSTGLGAKVLLENNGIKSKHLVLNIQTRPGQSGSPVFSSDGKNIVGMVLGGYAPAGSNTISLGGIDPQTLHQTTHAISAEYIKEMI